MTDAKVRTRKLLKDLVSHHSRAVRRTGDPQTAYSVRGWWWDKAATDKLLEEAGRCLDLTTDASLVDQILWHRSSIFWFLGRFDEAQTDLMRLNRPDSVYRNEIGRSLGLIRKRKLPHEAV